MLALLTHVEITYLANTPGAINSLRCIIGLLQMRAQAALIAVNMKLVSVATPVHTCRLKWCLASKMHVSIVIRVGGDCRCQCGADKCQGYLEADSAQNRAALLMDTDSGLDDDAGDSLMVSWASTYYQPCTAKFAGLQHSRM